MKLLVQTALMLIAMILLPITAQANKRLSIKSEPSGAKVEIVSMGQGPLSIGITPILSEMDDYWFDGPSSTETRYLDEPLFMRVSKEGYETKTEKITKGPFEWVSSDGATKKRYYLLTSTDFIIKLNPIKSSSSLSSTQQQPFIPPPDATWYKRATEEINQRAKSKLERALSAKASDTNTETLFAEGVVCGPLLWEVLRDQAGKELQDALQTNFIMTMPKQMTKEGRTFLKPEQKRSFWNIFMERIKDNNSVVVRRATKPEIDYYWSTISFNIEEPLYVVDIGNRKVLFNFLIENGEPNIFWMDIVGNL